jgi:hypothetical protein
MLPVDRRRLVSSAWMFSVVDGTVLGRVGFELGGRVSGCDHPHVRGWAVDERGLVILTAGGQVSTVYREVLANGDLVGDYLLEGGGRHRLARLGARVNHLTAADVP